MSDSTPSAETNTSPLRAEQVAEYLLEHPDFFEQHSSVLAELILPHESGEAISLVEKQVSILRERNEDIRQRLDSLLKTARDNDRLFTKTQALVLSLFEATTLDEVVSTLQSSLRDDYALDSHTLILLGEASDFPDANARFETAESLQENFSSLTESSHAICGVFRDSEMQFLFPDASRPMGSAAVVPLRSDKTFGLLAVGSFDPHHYRSSMGTLFLSYIADILNRLVPRLLQGQ